MSDIIQQSATCLPRKRRASLFSRLMAASAIARQRRKLHALDDHLLRDIGVTRAQAQQEARKSYWAAPEHWKN